jgi:glycine cleavage system aminomethyltransferase T
LTYTQFLNELGGIESDLTIARLADEHFRVITGTAFLANDLSWIQMHAPDDGSLTIEDVTEKWAVISLWGPEARNILKLLTNDDVSNEAFPYMTAQTITNEGVEVWAQRVSYVGELGWELYIETEQATIIWDAVMQAGKAFAIQVVGYKALESLRLEKGYRYWSADITPDENPYEAGLGFAVRLKSGGDFIGKVALEKVKKEGIQRRLSTLTIEGYEHVIYGGEAVYKDKKLVGRVRSGGYGYTVGKTIALSYLPIDLAKEGTSVEIEIFGEFILAQVAADVLYDAKSERLRA